VYLPDFKQTVKVVKTFIFDDKNNKLEQGDYLLKNIQPMITGYKHRFIYKNPQWIIVIWSINNFHGTYNSIFSSDVACT